MTFASAPNAPFEYASFKCGNSRSHPRFSAESTSPCAVHLDVGDYPVTVTEINGVGRVRFRDERPLVVLNTAKTQRVIQASVFSQRRLRASVSCPAEVLQQAGLVFRCTAVIDGAFRRYPFIVTEVDRAGHVRDLAT